MKKLMVLMCLCLMLLLGSCGDADETFIVSGTITNISCNWYIGGHIILELDDGIKVSIWDRGAKFSDGLEEGDNVCLKVQLVNGEYRIVGYGFESE